MSSIASLPQERRGRKDRGDDNVVHLLDLLLANVSRREILAEDLAIAWNADARDAVATKGAGPKGR